MLFLSTPLHYVVVSALSTGVSLPFQQQLLPSFPGTSPVGQYLWFYWLNFTG